MPSTGPVFKLDFQKLRISQIPSSPCFCYSGVAVSCLCQTTSKIKSAVSLMVQLSACNRSVTATKGSSKDWEGKLTAPGKRAGLREENGR